MTKRHPGVCHHEGFKKVFPTREAAELFITDLGALGTLKNAYHCHHGDHWHIGARRKNDTRAASADKPVPCPLGCGKRTQDDTAMALHLAQKHPEQAMAG